MFAACKKGHEKVVEVLLKHGVDTKVQSNFDHTAAQFAQRSQHFAIHNMLWEHEKRLANSNWYDEQGLGCFKQPNSLAWLSR